MIRERAHVTAVFATELTVSTQLKSGCGSCQQQNTCGAGIISKAFSDRRAEFQVPRPPGAIKIGDEVDLLLPEQALTSYSLLMYGLPIMLLLSIAVVAQWFGIAEGWSILAAFSGFALSFFGLRKWLNHRDVEVMQLLQIQQI